MVLELVVAGVCVACMVANPSQIWNGRRLTRPLRGRFRVLNTLSGGSCRLTQQFALALLIPAGAGDMSTGLASPRCTSTTS